MSTDQRGFADTVQSVNTETYPQTGEHRSDQLARRIAKASLWWLATVLTLVLLDDLTFGPFFWAVSRSAGAAAAVVLILAIYVPAQVLLVRAATAPEPPRLAVFFLRRLELERRSNEIATREAELKGRVAGAMSAIAIAPVLGGVLPPILLWRAGWSARFVVRLSYLTATIYALEFAALHGVLPTAI